MEGPWWVRGSAQLDKSDGIGRRESRQPKLFPALTLCGIAPLALWTLRLNCKARLLLTFIQLRILLLRAEETPKICQQRIVRPLPGHA